MQRIGFMILAILLSFTAGLPQAHADTSDELLTVVLEAYDNLLKLDSFTAESEQLYAAKANLEAFSVELEFTYHALVHSEANPQGNFRAHSAFGITMTNNMEPGPTTVAMEMFIDGETIYARIGDSNLAQGEQAGSIEPGWVNTDLLADGASPAYNGMNQPTFLQLFGMNYPFEPGAVASVSELESEQVDGQAMRVIQVTYTASNLDASGALDDMIEVFNGQAMGWTEDMTREMLTGGSNYTFAVWIGEDDHLPHLFKDLIEIESAMTYEGYTTTISATLTTATSLTGLNQPLTLTPPTVE